MAKKKSTRNDKSKSRKKSGKRGGFFRFLFGTPMRQILMVAVIIALLIILRIQLSPASSFSGGAWSLLSAVL
jgi:hypothetical protein